VVRDDAQACLLAYQFAELLLGDLIAKPEKERREALAAAAKLRDDVEHRYEAALASPDYSPELMATLRSMRARLAEHLPAASSS
jgi:hypothetical protein